jgi:hypothetical protein
VHVCIEGSGHMVEGISLAVPSAEHTYLSGSSLHSELVNGM